MEASPIIFTLQQKMLHHLIIKSSLCNDLSLFNGNMGIIIFFFRYAKHFNNTVFDDYATVLLENLLENINKSTPTDFASGITGVGWGIEYLAQNNFVEIEDSDFFKEIDDKVMQIDLLRFSDNTLEKGIIGIAHYILARLKGSFIRTHTHVFDNLYINNLTNRIGTSLFTNQYLCATLLNLKQNDYLNYSMDLKIFIDTIEPITEQDISIYPLGLKSGIAGYLFHQIINQNPHV